MHHKLKGVVWLLTICMIFGVAGIWGIGSLLTRSTNATVKLPGAPAQFVTIDSSSGVRLAATYWPTQSSGAPAILMLHGNGSNRGSMNETASLLNRNGYAVLAIDFRGHGQSTAAPKSFGLFEADDARAASNWLRQKYPTSKVGIIGFSLVGAASLLGEQGPIPADALVLEGVYPDIRRAIFNRLASRLGAIIATLVEPFLSYQSLPRFGVWPSRISPIHALASVKEPVMIVGGGNDTNTPPVETGAMYRVVKSHAELRILAGVNHDELGRNLPQTFQTQLLAFLENALKAPH